MPDVDQAVDQVKRNWRTQADKKTKHKKVVMQSVTSDLEIKAV